MVHVANAIGNGHTSIIIRTADTDVAVLAVAAVATLGLEELWVSYGTGKSRKVLRAPVFAKALGSSKSRCLAFFHALTGCDTTSFFAGQGKRTAWTTWENFPDVKHAFLEPARAPSAISSGSLSLIERYLILMYDKTSPHSKVRVDIDKTVYWWLFHSYGLSLSLQLLLFMLQVNDARKYLFTKKGRGLEGLPPTHETLKWHVMQATYQGGYMWGQATIPTPVLPDPTDWGWTLGKEGHVTLFGKTRLNENSVASVFNAFSMRW